MKNEINGMHPNISDTEKKLLQLLVTGASSKSIAEQMGLKDGTTRVYLHSLYKRIGVHNKTSAVTWYLDREQDASLALAAVVAAAETFGDRAVHGDLLSALGIMEVFLGPYGRMWDMLTRLDGDPAQPQRGSAIRTRSRKLWNALVRGDFGAAAAFFDREGIAKSFIESPSDAVVLATALLLGGYTARATKAMSCLKVRRGASIGITVDEKAALSAIDDFINERAAENALAGLHRLADRSARRPVFRHLLIVALFHMYKIRGDSSRATDVGNAIWVEAESARNHLQSMGDRTCPMEARLPTAPRIPKADLAKYLARLTA